MIGRDASRLGRSVRLTRWCAPPQLARCGDQLLDTASVVSQSVHGLKPHAPLNSLHAEHLRTPRRPSPRHSPFCWVALLRLGSHSLTPSLRRCERSWRDERARSDRRGRSTAFVVARDAVSYSVAVLLLLRRRLLVAARELRLCTAKLRC